MPTVEKNLRRRNSHPEVQCYFANDSLLTLLGLCSKIRTYCLQIIIFSGYSWRPWKRYFWNFKTLARLRKNGLNFWETFFLATGLLAIRLTTRLFASVLTGHKSDVLQLVGVLSAPGAENGQRLLVPDPQNRARGGEESNRYQWWTRVLAFLEPASNGIFIINGYTVFHSNFYLYGTGNISCRGYMKICQDGSSIPFQSVLYFVF